MRILFFSHEFPPIISELANDSQHILNEYANNVGIEVDFVTSSIDEKQHLLKIGENISIHCLPIGKNQESFNYKSKEELEKFYKEAYKFAKQLVKRKKYDLVHLFSLASSGHIAYKLWKKNRLPYIFSLREEDQSVYFEKLSFFRNLFAPSLKKIWENACFIITDSQELRKFTLKLYPQKEIRVIHNGIETEKFFPDYSKRNLDHFTIVCVSQIIPEKGVRFLIQAFKILSARYRHIRMFIVGDGNEKSSLEQLVMGIGLEDKIVFTGAVAQEKVLEYLHKSNVYVLPDLNENVDKTMFAALACGLPIVVTDTEKKKEFIVDGKNGFMVKMKNPDDIAEKLEKIILDENLAKNMENENKILTKKISWNSVSKEYLEVYKETINLRKINLGE